MATVTQVLGYSALRVGLAFLPLAAVLTAVATARTRALAAPGHRAAAVVGGYDRAFLIAAAFAAAASLVSLAAARNRRVIIRVIQDTQIPAAPAHADAA